MTPREIVLANIENTGAPRPGMTFNRDRINDFCGGSPGGPKGYVQKRWTEDGMEYYDDVWGNLWFRMADGCAKGEVHKPAISDWSQLSDYESPKFDLESCTASYRSRFEGAGDRFKTASMGGWIFNDARYIRKMEVYLMDMAMYPDELRKLHEQIADVYRLKIRAAGAAGADGIMVCEDMGTQTGLLFSPTMWREYFGELYTELFGLAHELGMKVLMHSCGQNWEIVPDLLEAGVDAFQFDQPTVYDMPALAALLRKYKAALWAPVDIQKVLPTGNREIIEKGTHEMCDVFAGSLICKNYPDLRGIGVDLEWDDWAYDAICDHFGIPVETRKG